MSEFFVNCLFHVHPDGMTDEAVCEAADLDTALELIRQAAIAAPNFRAITIVHVEDAPNLMQGTVPCDPPSDIELN